MEMLGVGGGELSFRRVVEARRFGSSNGEGDSSNSSSSSSSSRAPPFVRLRVGAGEVLSDAVLACRCRGLVPAERLPILLEQTVGGAVSTGSHGSGLGAAAHNVRARAQSEGWHRVKAQGWHRVSRG